MDPKRGLFSETALDSNIIVRVTSHQRDRELMLRSVERTEESLEDARVATTEQRYARIEAVSLIETVLLTEALSISHIIYYQRDYIGVDCLYKTVAAPTRGTLWRLITRKE